MDPALAALDFAKAGAILADMIASCLAAGALPFDPEGPDDHDLEDRRSTPVEAGLHIRSPVDAGAGPLEPGEHGPPIQSVEQGPIARLEGRADPGPRPRSRTVRRGSDQAHGLQGAGRRCGDGSDRCDLRPGSLSGSSLLIVCSPRAAWPVP